MKRTRTQLIFEEIARAATLETLRESGLDLVARGLTTVEEVFRITVE